MQMHLHIYTICHDACVFVFALIYGAEVEMEFQTKFIMIACKRAKVIEKSLWFEKKREEKTHETCSFESA